MKSHNHLYHILSLFYFNVMITINLFLITVVIVTTTAAPVCVFFFMFLQLFYSLDFIQHSLEVTCMLCLEQLKKSLLDQLQSCHC